MKSPIHLNRNKTRRTWLTLTLILACFPLGLPLISYNIVKDPEPFCTLSVITTWLILSIPWTSFLIYSTYKKFGIDFLTINIVCLLLYLLVIVPKESMLIFNLEKQNLLFELKPILYFDLFCFSIICICWILMSLKLIKINKEIQRCLIISSPEYQESVNLFEQATDLNDLNKKFYLFSSKHPGQLVVALNKVYKEKKLFFKKQSL